MNSNIPLLILKNKAKLSKLIENDAPYEEILKRSKILDKFILEQMIEMNKIKK